MKAMETERKKLAEEEVQVLKAEVNNYRCEYEKQKGLLTGGLKQKEEAQEEIQVLTAQVNAYSRECEKQKGLVAQNQERHKTEVRYTCTCTVQCKILMAAN